MTLDAWRIVSDALQFALTSVVAIYVYLANRERVKQAAFDALAARLDQRMDGIDGRLIQLEAAVRHAPGQQDFIRVHERIDTIDRLASRVDAQLEGISHQLQLITTHLMERAAP